MIRPIPLGEIERQRALEFLEAIYPDEYATLEELQPDDQEWYLRGIRRSTKFAMWNLGRSFQELAAVVGWPGATPGRKHA